MSATILIDADPDDCNWISELQRSKGRIPAEPTTAVTAMGIGNGEMAYSPNQPRKPDGKFGTGGGGSWQGSGDIRDVTSGTAGVTPDGMDSRKKMLDAFGAEMDVGFTKPGMGGQVKGQEDVVSRRLKRETMVATGVALDAQFPAGQLQRVVDKFDTREDRGIMDLPGSEASDLHVATPGMLVADRIMHTWAANSWNPYNDNSVALQVAMSKEFKTGTSPHMKDTFRTSGGEEPRPGGGYQKVDRGDMDAYPAANGYDMPVLRAAVRSMQQKTQDRLSEMGVGDTVTLYRGVGRSTPRGDASVDLNPGSSWSLTADTANSFGRTQAASDYTSGTGSRLVMTVPRSRIIGIPGAGVGCYKENEVVISRAPADKAFWGPTT